MLKRFVTYIYQYEGGSRGSNAGFVKADIRDAGCRMQIQLRMPDRLQGTCRVYLIVGGEPPAGIFAGEIPLRQGTGQLKLAYPRNVLSPEGHTVGQIQAVAIRCSGGTHLLSCWSDQVPEEVLYGKFDIWGEHPQPDPKQTPETETGDSVSDGSGTADTTTASAATDVSFPSDEAEPEPGPEQSAESDRTEVTVFTTADDAPSLSDAPDTASEPVPAATDVSFPSDEAEPEPGPEQSTESAYTPSMGIADAPTPSDEKLISFGVTTEPLSEEEMHTDNTPAAEITYEKIAISDIRPKLAKRNWYLCSNSFLIHGFFNYRYLILKTVKTDDQKKCFLGVPGIYEQPERTMAFMFGFPIFEPAQDGIAQKDSDGADAHTPQHSAHETGVFGYWMLQLMD